MQEEECVLTGAHYPEWAPGFKIQKNPSSLISSHTLIYVVHKIQSSNPFD